MTTHIHRRLMGTAGTAFLGHSLGRALRWLPVLALAASGLVHAQAWPSKPVRIVVPFSPGGTTDLLARVLGQQLSQNLGQQFVVDSKPGGGGSIGAVEAARAPADGYTLLLTTSSTHAVAPQGVAWNAIARNKNAKEMLALARQKPGYLNYSSSGIGTIAHLTTEALKAQAGVFITHIPYKGTGQAIPDLMSGVVHLSWDALASGLPHAKEGRVRALAVSGPQRSPLAPEIPTIAESGVPGFSVLTWFGLYAPRGLPPALAQRINEEVNKVLRSPEMAARYVTWGIEAKIGSPADFATMVAKDAARWSRLATELKLKVD